MERQRGRLFQPVQNFDGQTTTNVKKDVDAYFNAVFLGGESKNYNKFVSTDLGKAKSELSQYFSDSLQYSYDETDHIKPTEMKFQKFSDGLKLLTVNGVVTLLTTFSLLKIRRSLTLTCQLSV